ncbi:MAG: hypothetical protein KDH17_05245 [Rhodocyclaceae bacterium]|nr:hypothetical protein [Rhodocyclaceae bacterium]
MTTARLLLLALATAMLSACASTTIRNSWIDGTDHGGPPKKLAVFVAVTDDEVRRVAEDLTVRSLPAEVGAVPSYSLDLDTRLEEKALREKLAPMGFDAALVARLVSDDTTEQYIPPQTQFMPDPLFVGLRPYHRSFYAYYPVAYTYTTPGYTATTRRVIVDTVLYRLPEGKPVWSALTETVDPESSVQVVEELIDKLGGEMRLHGLLPPEK